MKFLQVFNKTPNNKKFTFTPRFYDPQEEERKERELRIKAQMEKDNVTPEKVAEEHRHSERIAGSFRKAKKTATVQSDPSASMLRLIILLILTIGLIAFIQFGKVALYGLAAVFIPFYLYLKFRKLKR